jgi:hypothetical protein
MDTTINCSPAQIDLFNKVLKTATLINRSITTQVATMTAWLQEQYGDSPPTYAQFWADREALKFLAQEKGLVDDQWVRKPYNMAVKALYGKKPMSPSQGAQAKRDMRSMAMKAVGSIMPKHQAKGKQAAQKPGMPKDAAGAARQMVDYYGMARVLIAFSTVLAEYRETAKEAKRLETLGQQYAETHQEETLPLPKRSAAMH